MMKENDVLKAQSLFLFLLFMVASLVPLSRQTQAYGEGFNSENFYPAIDNRSPILWESAYSVPQSSILYGYTMSYAFRPIELGDGENKRESISDHLQVNHLSIAYGIAPWLDVGINLPIALYSAPQNSGKYYSNLSRDRNFFFLGDTRIRAKVSFFPTLNLDFSPPWWRGSMLPPATRPRC